MVLLLGGFIPPGVFVDVAPCLSYNFLLTYLSGVLFSEVDGSQFLGDWVSMSSSGIDLLACMILTGLEGSCLCETTPFPTPVSCVMAPRCSVSLFFGPTPHFAGRWHFCLARCFRHELEQQDRYAPR